MVVGFLDEETTWKFDYQESVREERQSQPEHKKVIGTPHESFWTCRTVRSHHTLLVEGAPTSTLNNAQNCPRKGSQIDRERERDS